ncbi:sensor domain-containing protein [Natronorarus salvus]|uniref:sensor domain-containing protein n=1 Tax=Natronorarus salvus TaxID=3117733 RepID=UPI002F26A752
MTGQSHRTGASTGIVASVVGPLLRRRTYLALLYLLLALPIGFVYSMALGFGLVIGLAFSILVVGLGIMLATVLACRLAGRFEYVLAESLLGVEMERPVSPEGGDGLIRTLRSYLDDGFTWRALAFVSMKLWVGLLGLALSSALSMATAVARLPHTVEFGEVNGEPVVWTIGTLPEGALASLVGLGLLVLLAHLIAAFGYVAGRMAVHLLGDPASDHRNPS